jgi:hypothetical protein
MDRLGRCPLCQTIIVPGASVMFGQVFGVPNVAVHLACGTDLISRWRAAAEPEPNLAEALTPV